MYFGEDAGDEDVVAHVCDLAGGDERAGAHARCGCAEALVSGFAVSGFALRCLRASTCDRRDCVRWYSRARPLLSPEAHTVCEQSVADHLSVRAEISLALEIEVRSHTTNKRASLRTSGGVGVQQRETTAEVDGGAAAVASRPAFATEPMERNATALRKSMVPRGRLYAALVAIPLMFIEQQPASGQTTELSRHPAVRCPYTPISDDERAAVTFTIYLEVTEGAANRVEGGRQALVSKLQKDLACEFRRPVALVETTGHHSPLSYKIRIAEHGDPALDFDFALENGALRTTWTTIAGPALRPGYEDWLIHTCFHSNYNESMWRIAVRDPIADAKTATSTGDHRLAVVRSTGRHGNGSPQSVVCSPPLPATKLFNIGPVLQHGSEQSFCKMLIQGLAAAPYAETYNRTILANAPASADLTGCRPRP